MGTGTGLIIAIVVISTIVPLIFVVYFVSKAGGDKKVLATGMPGTAQILAVSETGMTVNDRYGLQFQLRVTLPGQAPFDASTRDFISPVQMPMVQPGTTVAVKVDSFDRSKVAIDWQAGVSPGFAAGAAAPDLSAGSIAAAIQSQGTAGVKTGSAAELLRTGQRVRGVLTEFADTGNTARSLGLTPSRPEFLDDPMFAVTLQLHIPNMAPVEGKVIQRVPRSYLTHLKMGLELNCAVDPSNPTREVAIDWGDIPS